MQSMKTVLNAEVRIKDAGLKVTVPRVDILELFERAGRPLRAKDATEKLKGSDMVTVYRTIETFVEAGLLNRMDFGEDAAYYEISHPGEDHHHVTCTTCHKRVDIKGCVPGVMEKVQKEAKGFSRITRHSIEFFGLCNTCAKK